MGRRLEHCLSAGNRMIPTLTIVDRRSWFQARLSTCPGADVKYPLGKKSVHPMAHMSRIQIILTWLGVRNDSLGKTSCWSQGNNSISIAVMQFSSDFIQEFLKFANIFIVRWLNDLPAATLNTLSVEVHTGTFYLRSALLDCSWVLRTKCSYAGSARFYTLTSTDSVAQWNCLQLSFIGVLSFCASRKPILCGLWRLLDYSLSFVYLSPTYNVWG